MRGWFEKQPIRYPSKQRYRSGSDSKSFMHASADFFASSALFIVEGASFGAVIKTSLMPEGGCGTNFDIAKVTSLEEFGLSMRIFFIGKHSMVGVVIGKT